MIDCEGASTPRANFCRSLIGLVGQPVIVDPMHGMNIGIVERADHSRFADGVEAHHREAAAARWAEHQQRQSIARRRNDDGVNCRQSGEMLDRGRSAAGQT